MKFHDLVLLLDDYASRYDEVAVFARSLAPNDVAVRVGAHLTIVQEADRTTIGFVYGNVWRFLRVEEKLGIVVLSNANNPRGQRDLPSGMRRVADPDGYLLLGPLHRAASVSEGVAVLADVLKAEVALLRRRDGNLHRNLVMVWEGLTGWSVLDSNIAHGMMGPFFGWIKNRLWSDVPKPCPECGGKGHTDGSGILDGKACEACGNTGIAMTYPFPGADAHPDKHGGELCVEGTMAPVADILSELAWAGTVVVDPESGARTPRALCHIAGTFGLNKPGDLEKVCKCLRGLADWLKAQRWTGNTTWEADNEGKIGDYPVSAYPSAAPEPPRPSEPPLIEKRCGTCLEGCLYDHAEVRAPCNHYADSPNRPDGPPWENCRFWKGR